MVRPGNQINRGPEVLSEHITRSHGDDVRGIGLVVLSHRGTMEGQVSCYLPRTRSGCLSFGDRLTESRGSCLKKVR